MRNRAQLEIELSQLDTNINYIRELAPKSQILLMVKAQAYGLGDEKIIQRAFYSCGVRHFGFATLYEAQKALSYLPNEETFSFYVFSETALEYSQITLDDLNIYRSAHIIPVISEFEALECFLKHDEFSKKPLIIKFDTGMKRFGFSRKDITQLTQIVQESRGGVIDHLMSHFPCASSKNKVKLTQSQYRKFLEIKSTLIKSGLEVKESSIANSAAIERGIGIQESFIRPGLLAYGNYSTKDNFSSWKGAPLARLRVRALKTFLAKKGTPIGYSGVTLKSDCLVCILPLGYADGLTQQFDKIKVTTHHGVAKFHGYMNMDVSYLIFEDTSLKPEQLSDSFFSLIDRDINQVQSIFHQTGISPYQIYGQFSLRVPRVYKIR